MPLAVFRQRRIGGILFNNARFFRAVPYLNASMNQQVENKRKKIKAEEKEIEASRKKLASLKSKLRKEKATFATTKKQLNEALKKQKKLIQERKAKEKAKLASANARAKKKEVAEENKTKKLVEKALKPFRKLSAYTMYVKENAKTKTGLQDAAKQWKQLSEGEKELYVKKADEYNAEMLKIFVPKPRAPASSYAAFVKENFPADGQDFKDINKELAAQWLSLPAEEKKKYAVDNKIKQEYKSKLDAWKEKRILAYKQFHSLP